MKRVCECGKEVEATFKFCPYCFTDFDEENEIKTLEEIDSISSISEDDEEQEEEPEEAPGELLFAGKYRLLEPLKSTPSGTICLVQHYKKNTLYVMKDFLIERRAPQAKEILKQELLELGESLSSFSHHSMSSVTDYSMENDTFYLIYNFFAGKSAASYIEELKANGKRVENGILEGWIKDIVSLLDYFQNKEPDSPYCCGNLRPYSFVISEDKSRINYINLGLPYVYRKIGICDPFEDEWVDDGKINHQSYDLYCFGLCIYYFLTGKNIKPEDPVPDISHLKKTIPNHLFSILEKLIDVEVSNPAAGELIGQIQKKLNSAEEESDEPAEAVPEIKKAYFWENIFLGNTQRTNSIGRPMSPYMHILWSIVIPAASQYYLQPWEETLVILSEKGHIYEFDLFKSALIRKTNLHTNTVAPIINEDLMYINSSSSQTAVYLETLEKQWEFRTKSMFLSPPNMIDEKLLTISYDGFLMVVDKDSGSPLSMENINQKVISPIVYDEVNLYIPSLSGNLIAINKETRVIDWSNESSSFTTAPAMEGDVIFAGNSSGKILAINKKSGILMWESAIKGAVTHGPVISENKVVCSSASGRMACFDISSGKTLWDIDFGYNYAVSFCVSGSYIYAAAPKNNLISLNIDNGKIYNQINFKSKIVCTPLYINGILYLITADGEICAFTVRG